jgi:hypothetical protein
LGLRRQRKRALGIRPGLSTTRRSSGGLGARGHGPDCAAIAEPVECRILDAATKARGVKLGGPKLAEARKAAVERNVANANQHAANVLPVIREIKRSGASLHQIAPQSVPRSVQGEMSSANGPSSPEGRLFSLLPFAIFHESTEQIFPDCASPCTRFDPSALLTFVTQTSLNLFWMILSDGQR